MRPALGAALDRTVMGADGCLIYLRSQEDEAMIRAMNFPADEQGLEVAKMTMLTPYLARLAPPTALPKE